MIEYPAAMRIAREVGITILIAVVIFVLLRINLQGYTVQHSSMLPSIEEGEWIMVCKSTYFFSEPQRGDVMVFTPPVGSAHPFIKRVIGLPGETIEVNEGRVYINSDPIPE